MFVCRACLRKSAGAAAAEARLPIHPLRAITANTPRTAAFLSTAAVSVRRPERRPERRRSELPPSEIPSDEQTPEEMMAKKRQKALEFAVSKHLQYLKDPLKIAEHVQATLVKDRYDEALLLVRTASRDTKLTVSWNHLIDYLMKNQRLNAAIKLYNEMKKRAQGPDARTYTTIFRGCAASEHPKLAVHEAMRIYNSMMGHATLQPNVIHMNCVLETCGRAGDLDSMFTVLKSVNKNIRTPDHQTFTIVLNALRYTRTKDPNLTEEDIKRENDVALERVRLVWEDVMTRYRDGQLTLDERLVCAMGRNLLLSDDRKDKEEVLQLVHDTMTVPRFDLNESASPPTESPPTTVPDVPNPTNLAPSNLKGLGVPKPSNNTLSLVLLCLETTKRSSVVTKYWDHFTTVYSVQPDKDNYIRYLKVLSRARASSTAASVITTIPAGNLAPLIFRMGLSTCTHDNLNRHGFENAKRIYNTMVTKARYPDPLAMRLFLQTARACVRHHYEQHPNDERAGGRSLGKQIYEALELMWTPFRTLMSSFSYPDAEQRPTRSPADKWQLTEGQMQEALAVAARMIAAIDKLYTEKLVSDEELKIVVTRRNILLRLVERYSDKEKMIERAVKTSLRKAEKAEKVAKKFGLDDVNDFARLRE
ncbi:hypothetical protein QBC39DRAFT_349330 [Podospora conica]|nr:hypothetical protein QBC39DRAFT_349330 [Schizothecium conicum]